MKTYLLINHFSKVQIIKAKNYVSVSNNKIQVTSEQTADAIFAIRITKHKGVFIDSILKGRFKLIKSRKFREVYTIFDAINKVSFILFEENIPVEHLLDIETTMISFDSNGTLAIEQYLQKLSSILNERELISLLSQIDIPEID